VPKNPLYRYDRWGVIFLFAIIIGLPFFLASLVFWINIRLFAIGFPLLTFGLVGGITIRRKVSALRHANPELFKAWEPKNMPDPSKCAICGAEPAFLYRCYYCKKYFCEKHKLPKTHRCTAAPKTSFRMALLMSPIMIFLGIGILYLAYLYNVKIPEAFAFGWLLVAMGVILPIGRVWEERQSNRAMGLR